MSTVPEVTLLVRTNETTSLSEPLPKKTFQVWPPTDTLVLSATGTDAPEDAIGCTAPLLFIHSMTSMRAEVVPLTPRS